MIKFIQIPTSSIEVTNTNLKCIRDSFRRDIDPNSAFALAVRAGAITDGQIAAVALDIMWKSLNSAYSPFDQHGMQTVVDRVADNLTKKRKSRLFIPWRAIMVKLIRIPTSSIEETNTNLKHIRDSFRRDIDPNSAFARVLRASDITDGQIVAMAIGIMRESLNGAYGLFNQQGMQAIVDHVADDLTNGRKSRRETAELAWQNRHRVGIFSFGREPESDTVTQSPAPAPVRQEHANVGMLQERQARRPQRVRRSRIIGFIFDDERHDTNNGTQTLIEILNVFQRIPNFMTEFAPRVATNTRRLVARRREDLYSPDRKDLMETAAKPLDNGWWLGSNLSTLQVRNNIHIACEIAGVSFGRQLRLIEIEV